MTDPTVYYTDTDKVEFFNRNTASWYKLITLASSDLGSSEENSLLLATFISSDISTSVDSGLLTSYILGLEISVGSDNTESVSCTINAVDYATSVEISELESIISSGDYGILHKESGNFYVVNNILTNLDAYLKKIGVIRTLSLDSCLVGKASSVLNLDSVLEELDLLTESELDSILSQSNDIISAIDSVLSLGGHSSTTIDAVIWSKGYYIRAEEKVVAEIRRKLASSVYR